MYFTDWILSHGISISVLEIIVFIPILATIINFARYFIGLKSFGIYGPIILALAYTFTGLRYGLLITLMVAVSSIISYSILRRFRMHYISRVALNYIVISITIVFGIMLFQSLLLNFDKFNMINPLAIVSIAALSDFFIKMYVKKSVTITIRVLIETVIVAIIGWYFITSPNLINYMIYNLWVIPLLILLNLAIGIYTGLRVKELFRFWYIAKDDKGNSRKI